MSSNDWRGVDAHLDKRWYGGLLLALAAGLSLFVLFDVYDDAVVQGEPLWLTLAENSISLLLLALFAVATYWLYRHRTRQYLVLVARWTVAGLVGILAMLLWVIGTQALQQEFKPVVLAAQTAIGGTIAGAGIGYMAASIRQSRAEIRTQKERWESLFENSPAGVADIMVDENALLIEAVNQQFESRFSVDRPGIQKEPLTTIVDHDETEIRAEIIDTIERGDLYATEVRSTTGDHRLFFKLRVVPYGIGTDQQRAFAIYTDVTELRETQQRLEEQNDQLAASNERLQQFAYIASHDLQEPLRMVSSYMGLLEDEYRDDLDEEAQEYIEFAANGADRMQNMIDGLLAYSRVQTEGAEFTETDATAVLEDTLRNLELRIDEASATVTYDDLPTVEADRNQLGQLFQNLVENALDHADEPEVHVGYEHRGGAVVFSISDDGPGIPEPQQEKIFDLFQRGDRDGDGTGMGLAICDRIVSRHGGDIWVDSAEGEGTTFYFSIPTSE